MNYSEISLINLEENGTYTSHVLINYSNGSYDVGDE